MKDPNPSNFTCESYGGKSKFTGEIGVGGGLFHTTQSSGIELGGDSQRSMIELAIRLRDAGSLLPAPGSFE